MSAEGISPVLQITAVIIAVSGALTALTYWVFRPVFRAVRLVMRFFSDWFGEEARDGVEGRPSVMARLEAIEHKAGRAEWHLGNGNQVPMRQVVDEHAKTLKQLSARVAKIDAPQRTKRDQ